MWVKRTNPNQEAVKLADMAARVDWSDKGTANVPKEDAQVLLDEGLAEQYQAEDDGDDSDESADENDTNDTEN